MSKPFDYSKWDNIELSDDEDDVHPNIDKESWFRLRHRSRVEREENEEKDKKQIQAQMEKANQRIKLLRHDLAKLSNRPDDDDSDDDDLDDREGLEAELKELEKQNAARQEKLDEYEKNKKWNVDNMFHVKEEKSIVNPKADLSYTPTGFVKPDVINDEDKLTAKVAAAKIDASYSPAATKVPATSTTKAAPTASSTTKSTKATTSKAASKPAAGPSEKPMDVGVMDSYPVFTEKYADTIELFMAIPDLAGSKTFLLQHADILLQENASNYLLLASLEDEMNGHREKMKRTARQSQIISNIAELARSMNTHPGNVIEPFFSRMELRQHFEEFMAGVNAFVEKIIARAVVKKREIDAKRQDEDEGTVLEDVPREQRLGPGGLDPLEVIETLPQDMVQAFESRNVDDLKAALLKLPPDEAEYHMKRCVDSGLWVSQS